MPRRYASGSSPRVGAGPAFGLRGHRAVISELALGLMSVGHPVELFASDVCGRGGAGGRRARPERLPVHRRGGDDSQARRRRVARPVGLPSERRRALLGAAVHRSSCRPLPAGVKPPPARSGGLRRAPRIPRLGSPTKDEAMHRTSSPFAGGSSTTSRSGSERRRVSPFGSSSATRFQRPLGPIPLS